jgi:soluble lytic murein transglycosylase
MPSFNKRWLEPFFGRATLRTASEKFHVEDWASAAEGFARAGAALPRGSPEYLPAKFLLAMARMNLSEWREAGAIFEELWDTYPLLGPYHALHAARCRLRRGDADGALVWAARVPPQSVLETESLLIRIEAFAAQHRWIELVAETARYLERFPAGARRQEVMLLRGEALEALGRGTDEPAALYHRIWTEAPLEVWGSRATSRLDALAAKLPPEAGAKLKTFSAAEWLSRGMVLFDRNQNVESELAFATALASSGLDANLTCRAQYHRAQSVWKQRQRPRAAPLFVEAVSACTLSSERDLLVKSLYQGARCLASSGDRKGALANYARIEAEHADHSYADDARLRAAEIALDEKNDQQAVAFLSEIPARYPKGDLVGESLWRLALRAIRNREWNAAREALDENLRRLPREDIWYAEGRALYWRARILELEGKGRDATAYYARAVREYPLSVYALFALERMRRSSPKERAVLLTELRGPAKSPAGSDSWRFGPQAVFADPGFLRAVELARLGLGPDARRELGRLGFATPDGREAGRQTKAPEGREDVYWIGAVLLDRGRVWSASHTIPRYSLTGYRRSYPAGRGKAEWRISYPRAFPEIVSKICRDTRVPEALQLAIMREESAFNPRVESFANALGLTQMLVRSAQRFSPTKVTREMLLDPAKNVELGSRYLAFLLEHFHGAVPLAIPGYNGGEAAVDRWLAERGNVDLDEFIETIPFDETRNYTKRVLASYFAYSWLYQDGKPVPALSFALKPSHRPGHVGRPAGRSQTRRPAR